MRAPRVEPQDMYNVIAGASADQQLSIVVALPGRVDAAMLEAAAAALIADEPVLACRYVPHPRRPSFEPGVPAEVARPHTAEAADPWAAALAWAAVPVDPARDPLFATALSRGPSGDVLAMRIHHAATDGQGAKQVTYRLAEAYSALAEGHRPLVRPAGSRSGLQVLRRISPLSLVRALLAPGPGRPRWGTPRAGEPGERAFELRRLDADRFGALRAYGKRAGATVNDLAVTSVVRALFEALEPPGDQPMLLNVSFDLRRYLPQPPSAAAANLSSIETLALRRVPGEAFGDTLRRVSGRLTALKSGTPGLQGAVQLEIVGRLGYGALDRRAASRCGAGGSTASRSRSSRTSASWIRHGCGSARWCRTTSSCCLRRVCLRS